MLILSNISHNFSAPQHSAQITFGLMAFRIMSLRIKGLYGTLNIIDPDFKRYSA
jgi:hypothetical protein